MTLFTVAAIALFSQTTNEDGAKRAMDAARAARLPAPGTVAPASVAFTTDGSAVTYLMPEEAGLSQVLWKAEVKEGAEPRVLARAPGEGNAEGTLSREEALRRERQRQLATGLSQVVRASVGDLAVLPIQGDLYLLRGGELERLAETAGAEIDPQFSPDGSKLAYVRNGALYVRDLGTKEEKQLSEKAAWGVTYGLAEFMAQEELGRNTGFWWSPDGKRIAYQKTDERPIPEYVIVHQETDRPSDERHRYPFAGADNAKVTLGVVGVDGGETTWLTIAPPGEDNYLARVDWQDATHLLAQVLPRDQKSLRLVRVDVEKDNRETLREEKAADWVNLHDDLRLVAATGEILWAMERSGFKHLVLLDRDGKEIRELTNGDWAVDEVVFVDEGRREVWFLSGRGDPREKHLERVSMDGGEIRRMSPEAGTHRAAVSPKGNHYVLTSSSLDRPPVTTLRDREGRVMATLADASRDPSLAEVELIRPTPAEFESRDGVRLYGLYYPARGKTGEKSSAMVVYVYGGPHVQRVVNDWSATADPISQFLAARGFAVWVADNRGASRRGHAFEAAIDRNMGDVEVKDQADGVKYAAGRWPEIEPARVGITGASYGGYMTLRALQLAPDVFRAGVSRAPVTDWDGYDTAYTERYMGTPSNNSPGYAASSVLMNAEKTTGELLIVHGLLDENVHFRHSARLAAALIQAGKTFELLPIPDERHGVRKEENRKYVYERMGTFFERALSPR